MCSLCNKSHQATHSHTWLLCIIARPCLQLHSCVPHHWPERLRQDGGSYWYCTHPATGERRHVTIGVLTPHTAPYSQLTLACHACGWLQGPTVDACDPDYPVPVCDYNFTNVEDLDYCSQSGKGSKLPCRGQELQRLGRTPAKLHPKPPPLTLSTHHCTLVARHGCSGCGVPCDWWLALLHLHASTREQPDASVPDPLLRLVQANVQVWLPRLLQVRPRLPAGGLRADELLPRQH